MEEVISKSDGQFKVILDDLVDYKKHASKKDPLIKELSRPNNSSINNSPTPTPTLNNKPAASLNSSIYSSAASTSSSSSSSTTSSSSSSSSADSTTSSSSSTTSSASSSPSQSQAVAVGTAGQHNDVQDNYGKLEVAKMEDLRKKARILEHHRTLPAALNAAMGIERSPNGASRTDETAKGCRSSLSLATGRVDYEPLASIGLLSGQQAASSGAPAISPNGLSGASSWKTIIAKRDKRRKKPVEKTILAKEIPGNRGDQSVEELAKFIKSRTSGPSNSGSNNKNIKIKSQNNPNSASNPSDNHNNNTYCNNSAFTNNDSAKKNESHLTSNNNVGSSGPCKPIQISSKMNNHTQPRSQPQTKQNQSQQFSAQTTVPKISQIPSKQPNQSDYNNHENHHPKGNSSKPSQPIVHQQSKNSANLAHKQTPQSHQPRRVPQPSSQQAQPVVQQQTQPQPSSSPQPQPDQQQSKQVQDRPVSQPNAKTQKPAAVTFANHIRVRDEDVRQYTFGFFDEQSNQTNPTAKPTNNSHAIANSRQQSLQDEPKKTKSKQPKTSPNSEETLVECKKDVSAKNVNYEQIYKFIRDAWETVAAQASHNSHNH